MISNGIALSTAW